ncbi:ABC transporter permease [Clostridium tyrobutyricum]|uniref:ABC transporter permease n=1 Tax=Clostridium tyrobutyricum TaxID=1519 RepID=UPI001C38C015|nr:ABC transporter permease [Clostridium tyrobutyricum]MBV4418997.1 ABC transporter permease [Clostridium tyrobutyricum]
MAETAKKLSKENDNTTINIFNENNKKKVNIVDKFGIITRKSIAIIVFFILWQILPTIGVINKQFVPPIFDIVVYLGQMLASGELITHIQASLIRVLEGFGLSVLVGVPLGFLLGGWFKKFEEILNPLLQVLAQINPFTLFPIFMLLFGIGEVAKVSIIFWTALWAVLFQTINGVRNIDPTLIKGARAMATPKFSLFYKVVLPGAAPLIFSGFKTAMSTACLMLIAAEMIGASKGLGWLILNAQNNYNINRLYAAAIAIALLGLVLLKLLDLLEHFIVTWREHSSNI